MKKTIKLAAVLMYCTTCAAGAVPGDQGRAREILDHVGAVYSQISGIRIHAKQEDQLTGRGQAVVSDADIELASDGHRYFAHVQQPGTDATEVSDGVAIWKALATRKQWARIEAAGVEGDGDAGDAGEEVRTDLYALLAPSLFRVYAKAAQMMPDAALMREDRVKSAAGKTDCWVIKGHAGKAELELWIDKNRFFVVKRRQTVQSDVVRKETTVQILSIEANVQMPDSQFQFAPGKGWAEVEAISLPGEQPLLTGARAGDFRLKALDGEELDTARMRGQTVVLDFWATWCPPCRAEMPSIEKLRAEFGDRVRFYGVNDEDAGTVRAFVKRNGYGLTVLMDGRKQVHRQYSISAIPTLVIIDSQGIIRSAFTGSRDEATLRKAIQSALGFKD